MAASESQELVSRFEEFYRTYYHDAIGELAQQYPNERRSLFIDWGDLYRFDQDLADDYRSQPEQLERHAREALRLYDLPVDVSLGQAHVRIRSLPSSTDIREIRARHVNTLVSVRGIVRKGTDVRPKIQVAAFECQRCGTLSRIPQDGGKFQEPHECQGCERQGPYRINFDQSQFVDAQKLRIQESPEGLRGGETPQTLDVHIEDDITGEVTPGDHVVATGTLRLEQQQSNQEKSTMFDVHMEGSSVEVEEEQFEDMEITEEDKQAIVDLSSREDIYEQMVESIAPTIYGHDSAKLAMALQLFSGVTKHLPDGSRTRGDLHMLLIGDPGTGKCVSGDTRVTLGDGSEVPIGKLVESHLDDPRPVDDGVYQEVEFEVPSLQQDGTIANQRVTKVWKREAPDTMYRIRTASGRELEVTPSHPLFVQSNGKFTPVVARDLSEGEFVAVPRELPCNGDDRLEVSYRLSKSRNAVRLDLPETWTPGLARLVGYVVAEGYVERRSDHTGFVSITNNDHEILDDVAATYDELGVNYFRRSPHAGKTAKEIVCSSGELVSFLHTLDENLVEGSANCRVPPRLFGVTPAIKSAFLSAYIEGEGHVSTNERELTVASMSEQLLENVRSLLLTLGIDSQLHERHNNSYRLRISGAQFERYVRKIGFVTERKSRAAASYEGTTGNTNRDVVPNVGAELKRIRTELGLAQADCGIPRSTFQHYERGSRNPSRRSLRQVVKTFETAVEIPEPDGGIIADGGVTDLRTDIEALGRLADGAIAWDRIEAIEAIEPVDEWVYDLEVEETHNYVTNNVISHNSQLLQYIRNIAPRSVYTSGKGSSSAGLTAAAVRDDFGDGQQWTLEAGALVLADRGIAAVDELDKMRPEDRSAMHEALEQQSISISKAGINATLKSRCSLLGAANPKHGRFDQYESFGEQIDLEPALISRFDLIFTVTDQPDEEKDRNLADHILQTNYAGELHTQRTKMNAPDVTQDEVDAVSQDVSPAIEAELLRKYVAYAQQTCYPRLTPESREAIQEFYVNLRSRGADDDAPVPVTARKLEALVRLSEASARIRLSDTIELEDAERVIEIVRTCLQEIGVDPETGQYDADVIETGRSKTQRDRVKGIKQLIRELQEEYEDGAPIDEVLSEADRLGIDRSKAEHEIQKLRDQGEVYSPNKDHLRVV